MDIVYYKSLVSTNDEAKKRAYEGAPHLFTVVADTQTGGRGRLGRSFLSPVGGTYLSVVLRPSIPRAAYGAITPMCAVAVHRALQKSNVCTEIKWVNDLLFEGKKLCGILCEASDDREGKPFAVLGIGINTGDAPLPPEIADIATHCPVPDRQGLIEAILSELSGLDEAFVTGEWRDDYRRYASFLGSDVWLTEKDLTVRARALDIDAYGGLVVKMENGVVKTLYGGEISLRKNR